MNSYIMLSQKSFGDENKAEIDLPVIVGKYSKKERLF